MLSAEIDAAVLPFARDAAERIAASFQTTGVTAVLGPELHGAAMEIVKAVVRFRLIEVLLAARDHPEAFFGGG